MYSDFGQLQKGTLIPKWWIERHVGIQSDADVKSHRAYQLALMELGEEITRLIYQKQGVNVFVKYEKGAIRILTDLEAESEAPRCEAIGVRKIRRTYKKACDIDSSQLDPEAQKRLNFTLRRMSFRVDALNKRKPEALDLLK